MEQHTFTYKKDKNMKSIRSISIGPVYKQGLMRLLELQDITRHMEAARKELEEKVGLKKT